MSFHGGLLGTMAAMALYAWRQRRNLGDVFDFTAPLPALGLFFGRIGNFINGELWGRVTDPNAPWAVLFPQAAEEDRSWMVSHAQEAAARGLTPIYERTSMLPRHPSQLYEAALEGLLLFALLWFFARRKRPLGAVSAMFLIG